MFSKVDQDRASKRLQAKCVRERKRLLEMRLLKPLYKDEFFRQWSVPVFSCPGNFPCVLFPCALSRERYSSSDLLFCDDAQGIPTGARQVIRAKEYLRSRGIERMKNVLFPI